MSLQTKLDQVLAHHAELGMMLQQLGLRVIEASGHRAHRGAYFGSESPRLILLAEKG